jgi:transposase InsO family protein
MPLNGYVERENKTYKTECLDSFRPTTLEEVKSATEAFQQHSNEERPLKAA